MKILFKTSLIVFIFSFSALSCDKDKDDKDDIELEAEVEFSLSVLGDDESSVVDEARKFKFFGNSETGLWNVEVTGTYNFRGLTVSEYSSITSKAMLKDFFENAPEENQPEKITRSVLNLQPVYFISQVGNDYFLIKWVSLLQDGSGTGTAIFTSRK
ncbi:MAG: hypothetical protein LBL24_11405 [Bacteroidales bacterium]|jgi:hypothetical protein|nr:hypothetical protein [Bacteroidales bacterium]